MDRRGVLVVEDDERTAAFLADNLRADGFQVAVAADAGEAIRAIEVRSPDLLLLDLTLGASSGLSVLDRVRSADGIGTRVDPQLLERVHAVLRRASGRVAAGVLVVGELSLDPLTRVVRLGGRTLTLSAK